MGYLIRQVRPRATRLMGGRCRVPERHLGHAADPATGRITQEVYIDAELAATLERMGESLARLVDILERHCHERLERLEEHRWERG